MRSLAGTTPGPKHHYLNLPRHNDRLARTVQVGSSEQVQYYHKNYLDHVYAITDEDGDALEHIRYCPRSKTRDDQREGFASNEPLIAAKLSAFGLPTYYDFSGLKVATSPTGNQFLWNAKRLDPQLGWYLYHYRHYSPELGRWPSRDPIEEQGGMNLYGFVGNGPLYAWDKLGLEVQIIIAPSASEITNGVVGGESKLNFDVIKGYLDQQKAKFALMRQTIANMDKERWDRHFADNVFLNGEKLDCQTQEQVVEIIAKEERSNVHMVVGDLDEVGTKAFELSKNLKSPYDQLGVFFHSTPEQESRFADGVWMKQAAAIDYILCTGAESNEVVIITCYQIIGMVESPTLEGGIIDTPGAKKIEITTFKTGRERAPK